MRSVFLLTAFQPGLWIAAVLSLILLFALLNTLHGHIATLEQPALRLATLGDGVRRRHVPRLPERPTVCSR